MAFRAVHPETSDEEFAQDYLGVSPRTLYNWQRQPDTALRPGTQKVLQDFYESASAEIRARFEASADHYRAPTNEQLPTPTAPVLSVPPDVGLAYPDQLQTNVEALKQLWRADLHQAPELLVVSVDSGAWHEAALSWLVDNRGTRTYEASSNRQVGTSDIARLQTTTEMFDYLDGQFGGGHGRSSLVEYLSTELGALLHGTFTEQTGRELFRAAAQATLLCAWMSYDAGAHSLAQRYFIQALGLADASGDKLVAASILDAMSHQATFLGRYREAANLARAASTGTRTLGSNSLAAHFHVMEARALARTGDAAACDRAISAAVREYERRDPGRDPEWFQYFDEAELAAELGHCNRDLGRPVDATTYATQSVRLSGESPRSDFFVSMVLADAHLDHGDVEQACEVALRALRLGEQLESARCVTYVDEFRQRLSRLGNTPIVRDFAERARSMRLWIPDNR
ncbi:MAG: XRE family transcriptional regulator [Pseudonocardiaceae bacterium]|nr:XRE family transcriptional regulator [Pseudonocardiaceae bacterium]